VKIFLILEITNKDTTETPGDIVEMIKTPNHLNLVDKTVDNIDKKETNQCKC
jgi:hypothetical protein